MGWLNRLIPKRHKAPGTNPKPPVAHSEAEARREMRQAHKRAH